MESGKSTRLSFNKLNAQGESVYRGGGKGYDLKGLRNSKESCTQTITR